MAKTLFTYVKYNFEEERKEHKRVKERHNHLEAILLKLHRQRPSTVELCGNCGTPYITTEATDNVACHQCNVLTDCGFQECNASTIICIDCEYEFCQDCVENCAACSESTCKDCMLNTCDECGDGPFCASHTVGELCEECDEKKPKKKSKK